VREQCQQTSLRHVAAQAGVDAANLSHVLTGRTRPSEAMLARLEAALVQRDWEHA
jgi:transcriptional regulator with XRE-family HTH domain